MSRSVIAYLADIVDARDAVEAVLAGVDIHEALSGSSISSDRHAAYARAAWMSSFSK